MNKAWHATVFRIYYSGFVYKAAACILHSKTNTVLLSFSANLFSWVELMTNNMLEKISSQSKPINYSTAATKKGKFYSCTMKEYAVPVGTISSSIDVISNTFWNTVEVNSWLFSQAHLKPFEKHFSAEGLMLMAEVVFEV